MRKLIPSVLLAGLAMVTAWKPSRFYLMSFLFPFLSKHHTVGRILGIKYVKDTEWKTTRKESHIYMTGLFVKLFTRFTGMPVILSHETRKALMVLQTERARFIAMEQYFTPEALRTITNLEEFETWLSRIILIETNRVFELMTPDQLTQCMARVETLRLMVKCLMGKSWEGLKLMWKRRDDLKWLSSFLRTIPEEKRLLVFVPQLTIISNFSQMLISNPGLKSLEPHHFLEPTSAFFTMIHSGQMTLVSRSKDESNYPTNLAFGPIGFQCPGNIYTFKFIKTILTTLQSCEIRLSGTPKYSGTRFVTLENPREIMMSVTRK